MPSLAKNSKAASIFWRAASDLRVPDPGSVEGAVTEDVTSRPVEGVPVADGDAKVILHPLAGDEAIRIVDLELEADWPIPGHRSEWATLPR